MLPTIEILNQAKDSDCKVVLLEKKKALANYFAKEQLTALQAQLSKNKKLYMNNGASFEAYYLKESDEDSHEEAENLRHAGWECFQKLKETQQTTIQLKSELKNENQVLEFLEGLLLSSYTFEKYKSKKSDFRLVNINLVSSKITAKHTEELLNVVKATFIARDLVNEPVISLTAEQLGKELMEHGKVSGIKVEVLNHSKIKALKMGGLLSVNLGSLLPPTFSILEYKPKNAINTKPYVLVGKGVVYDTGGLSLKPTPNSMDMMKCDMAGAATVAGGIHAIALNKLPVHVIGLIPATDNRPGQNAITPGDVITMFDGQTVEVLNTDAEGRLILADAIAYADKYDPEWIMDFATLTGSAVAAIGPEGAVMMGTMDSQLKSQLTEAGNKSRERLVEFPLWKIYHKQIESDIADLKNLGGQYSGAITAGVFLSKFTKKPWAHIDLAGPAYIKSVDSYRGKNGTGFGVRLIYRFIQSLVEEKHGKSTKK
jgi:leucyl aminopeptidase